MSEPQGAQALNELIDIAGEIEEVSSEGGPVTFAILGARLRAAAARLRSAETRPSPVDKFPDFNPDATDTEKAKWLEDFAKFAGLVPAAPALPGETPAEPPQEARTIETLEQLRVSVDHMQSETGGLPSWLGVSTDLLESLLPPAEPPVSAPLPPQGETPQVAGELMSLSIAEFERRCRVTIGRELENPSPDNALIALLSEAVRLGREQCALASPPTRDALTAQGTTPFHCWTPDPKDANRCIVCGDGPWGIHRFQPPATPGEEPK